MTTVADTNKLIFLTLRAQGALRDGQRCIHNRVLAFSAFAAAGVSRAALDALCVETAFSSALLIKLDGDRYARRLRVWHDYAEIVERDDLKFDVTRGSGSCYWQIAVCATEKEAVEAADRAERSAYHAAVRATDATFHGAERNDLGEAICMPEPR